jgi:hypothetical protein
MMNENLIIPNSIASILEKVSDDIAGEAIKMIISYYIHGVKPLHNNIGSLIIAQQGYDFIDRQKLKQERISIKRKESGALGGKRSAVKRKGAINSKTFKKWLNQDLIDSIKPFISEKDPVPKDDLKKKFTRKMCNEFYRYWSEPNSQGMMRMCKQETWDTLRRLIAWSEKSFNKEPQQVTTAAERGVHIKD